MAAPWSAPIDETERAKIVKLYREHGLAVNTICTRLRCGSRRIRRALDEADVEQDGRPRHYQEAP